MTRPTEHEPPLLRLYAELPRTQALGPYLRYGVWVQGCSHRCLGCFTPDALSYYAGYQVAHDVLARRILAVPEIEGITLSGGEPFSQARGLAELIQGLREKRDLGVILYTGFREEELRRMGRRSSGVMALLERVDLLVDGPYRAEQDDGLALRGSSNQRILALSPRYQDKLSIYGQPERQAEIHVLDGVVFLAGIPGDAVRHQWQTLKTTTSTDFSFSKKD
ncbi:MAG: radical SAM protein [Magnetococcales bacterium]|nr:radical SAM protein [Magnetococcales bacterium]